MESLDWRVTDSTRCSVARTAAVVGDGWTVLLLRDLFNGLRRFDELAVHLGVARNVLTRRLGGLAAAGGSTRGPHRGVRPRGPPPRLGAPAGGGIDHGGPPRAPRRAGPPRVPADRRRTGPAA